MPTFASEQVTRLQTLLASNVGVAEVVVGNTRVKYDDLLRQYDYWKAKASREDGSRPRAAQVDLGGF